MSYSANDIFGPQAQPQPAAPVTTTAASIPTPQPGTYSAADIFGPQAGKPPATTMTPPANTPPVDKGYLSGLWDSTVGGLTTFGKQMYDYYANKAQTGPSKAGILTDAVAGPATLLVDAAKDPNHPIHQAVKAMIQSHVQTAQKAWGGQKQAYATVKQAIDAARRGDYASADSLATQADMLQTDAMGHGLATIIPVLGPAAAKVGEDFGAGRTGYAAGEATGLIGSVVAPELARTGVSKVLGKVAPRTTEIAGEAIPVRASQESGLANAAETVAPSKSLSEFDINKTQPGVRKAIGNIASEVGSKEISNQTLAVQATDIGERADQIRTQSQPVFKKLDDLTKDEDMTFSDWQKQESGAYRRGDYEAVQKAKAAQDQIIDKYKDQFAPTDLQNARANWRQASALDKVDKSLNTKSVIGPTPVEFRPKGTVTPDPGYINGKAFSKQIFALDNNGVFDDAGLTPEHVQSLKDLGTLLEKSANVHKVGQLARLTEMGGGGLTAVLHPTAAIVGAKAALPGYLAYRFLGRAMTDAAFADNVVNVLKAGEPVAPIVSAQGITRSDEQ